MSLQDLINTVHSKIYPTDERKAEMDGLIGPAAILVKRDFRTFEGDALVGGRIDHEALRETGAALLAELKDLRELEIREFELPDLGPISQMTSLSKIHLMEVAARDLSPLSCLPGLTSLTILWNAVPLTLAPLPTLETLALSWSKVEDFGPLATCHHLRVLTLTGTSIDSLAPLAALRQLKELTLSDTAISTISPLGETENLQKLALNGTQVSDLAPLKTLSRLEYVWLGESEVSNLDALEDLPLKEVSIGQDPSPALRRASKKLQRKRPDIHIYEG